MAITLEELQVKIKADINGYNTNLKKALSQTKSTTAAMNSSFSSITSGLAQIGAAVGVAFSVKAVVDFSKACINVASDLAEVQNVVDVTFGAGNKSIADFSKNAAKQYGLSELAAKKYASTSGAMFKSMGLGTEQVEEMSIAIAGLTGDMASFYNLDSDTAFQKLRSGLSGETEPLKQLGINMSAANLEAFRLQQGIKTQYKNMSQAEQVMLRYNYILNSTADAQGDFARTTDSWANQTRILNLQFQTLMSTLGEGLINALTPAIIKMNEMLELLQPLADGFRDLSIVLFGSAGMSKTSNAISDTFSDINDNSAGVVNAFKGIDKNAKKATKSVNKLNSGLSAFDRLNMLTSGSGSSGSSGTGNKSDKLTLPKIDIEAEKKQIESDVKTLADYAHDEFVSDWEFAPQLSNILKNNLKEAYTSAKNGDWTTAKQKLVDNLNISIPFSATELSVISPQLALLKSQIDKMPQLSRAFDMSRPQGALSNFNKSLDIANNKVNNVGNSFNNAVPKVNNLANSIKNVANTVNTVANTSEAKAIKTTNSIQKTVTSAVSGISKNINNTTSQDCQNIVNKYAGVTDAIKNRFNNAFNQKEEIKSFGKSVEGLANNATLAAQKMQNTFNASITNISKNANSSFKKNLKDWATLTEKTLKNMVPAINHLNDNLHAPKGTTLKKSALTIDKTHLMASGGVVTGATRAIIGEGSYNEAVIPLRKGIFSDLGVGSSDEELALMKEQNSLLRALVSKDTSIKSSDIYNAVKTESRNVFLRTGNNGLVF